ncbi:DNA cytosine methyltransferase [Pseudomonas aeruginosa]|nr:DNA cytosine methyltransferase [Pseudomonas aeruginosa]
MGQEADCMTRDQLVAIDLFAGGGGLSLGLKQAGFLVSAAVELDEVASATYQRNHPEAVLFSKDIKDVTGAELVSTSPTGRVDLVAACPPCQSFSSLTSKYKREDGRDKLINEFARIVAEILPRTIMMENVPGLAGRGGHLFEPVIKKFKSLGYQVDYRLVEVADYGVPQCRKRLVVLGCLDSNISIPAPTHAENPENGKAPWVTVRDALKGLSKPLKLSNSKRKGGPRAVSWHVVRDISEINQMRLASLSEGGSRTEIPLHLRPACHKSDIGFTNVYGRMAWDKPSPTITGGCTVPSKGRFGHPKECRTISVREAARLQTFPDSYVFETDHIDKVCLIIGNALPPKFASVMASVCMDKLRE